jgi:hypothetical protein
MNRKATRQSPGIDAAAKRHLTWIKSRGICCACGNTGGVIGHHFAGSSAKVHVGLQRVHIGNWAINGLCEPCDNLATRRGRVIFREMFGNECDLWLKQAEHYPEEIPLLIIQGVIAWRK